MVVVQATAGSSLSLGRPIFFWEDSHFCCTDRDVYASHAHCVARVEDHLCDTIRQLLMVQSHALGLVQGHQGLVQKALHMQEAN